MTQGTRNLAASVAARLLTRAKQTGDDYQRLLTSFCFERFLYRLGESSAKDRFVLKGAMLLRVWSQQPYRATRDLDLLRQGDSSDEAIRSDLAAVCSLAVDPDAVVFDASQLRLEAMRAEDEYAGTRVTVPARCGTLRLILQIRATLTEAVRRTLERRRTPAPIEDPLGLTTEYWENASRARQVGTFARRAGLDVSANPGPEILATLRPFLLPLLIDVRGSRTRAGTWPPGGPWENAS